MSKELKAQDTVYVPVSVKDGLPDQDGFYYCIFENNRTGNNWFKDGKWMDSILSSKESDVTFWLKPLTSQYVFSADELREFAGRVFEAGYSRGFWNEEIEGNSSVPDKSEFIKQLLP